MWLKQALKDKELDVRLIDKHISSGKVTKKQVDDFYKSLNDDEKNVSFVGVTKESTSQE